MTFHLVAAWRIAWTVVSLIVVQTIVCGISALPIVWVWQRMLAQAPPQSVARTALASLLIVPSYVAFAILLMIVSPLANRIAGWRTPVDALLPLANMDWLLLQWVRYGASIHLVRIVAGSLFRGTPLWTMHLRLNGAHLGKRVYVNSLAVSDYNLLDFGDGTVIGGSVHLSGHTVEGGFLKTARVRLGRNVTVGLGSVIEIGVEIGDNALIGALSFVPKFTHLKGGVGYAGAPAEPIVQEQALKNRQRGA